MRVEIINIGDELLIGQVLNTNSQWMSSLLDRNGFEVVRVTIVSDNKQDIVSSVKRGMEEVDIILITGGLGPTKDDITKQTLCELFDTTLEENQFALDNIKRIFAKRGYILSPTNAAQALMPKSSKLIPNINGTACGFYFERDAKLIISMPGVPFEMEEMMKNEVIPLLISYFKPMGIAHRTLLTQGIGESFLSDKLEEYEKSLPENLHLAYLPGANFLRLRISAKSKDREEAEALADKYTKILIPLLENNYIGFDKEDLSLVLAELLLKNSLRISIAESCTGGYISHKITKNPGSSQYYYGSITAYSNTIKNKVLNIEEGLLNQYGAVSQQVSQAMAENTLKLFNTDYSISTTGIAGPGNTSKDKPIGLVWISVANKEGRVISQTYNFASTRQNFIERTSNQAIALLIKTILEDCS
ncbi:MAG: competence/damage-inducible protein A [Bacteroidales bacterium]|nr:competence/damage-inducible protein A [Bacteroidales bacterium]